MSKDTINILMLGDLIGNPGLEQLFLKLPELKKKEKIDLAIANGENSDKGFGITEEIIGKLKNFGIDVITSGNHIWSNRDAEFLLEKYDCLLRPDNYPDAKGKGYWTGDINGIEIGVVNLLGRHLMTPIDCPFQTLNKLLKKELKKCKVVIVDFHAELPQEKAALAHDFDGKITLIAGTHTHVQTADERILPNGTGYITDLGLCGGIDSVIGMEKDSILKKLKNQVNVPFVPSRENGRVQGIIATVNTETGQTVAIKRINR